jgi:hypothetical protein
MSERCDDTGYWNDVNAETRRVMGASERPLEAGAPNVGTKSPAGGKLGNDASRVGFIRVRRRKLKGGHPMWQGHHTSARASASFDLVRAMRVGGKPRHQFVLGLGSLKDNHREGVLALFWAHAIRRMARHGLTLAQRRCLIDELVRKGAPLPTVEQCRDSPALHWSSEAFTEVISVVEASLPKS